ncbi:hypothetical protein Hanom_Chr05g00425921 [Helianthus anomalus]
MEDITGGMPPLKWEVALFEQIINGHQFTSGWDAPPGYITLISDFLQDGNFRLLATNFFGEILSYYRFHVSQISPLGMVWVRHFKFGLLPAAIQSRIIFFCHAQRGKENFEHLPPPPKSYHNWKDKFFFIREKVVPIAMDFCAPRVIIKETLVVPKCAGWYMDLKVLSNQAFGESTLVATGMSDKWPRESLVVVVFLQDGASKFHIQVNFMYPSADSFATPLTATEGPRFLNPRPCRAITFVGKKIVILSREESITSSDQGLTFFCYTYAGVLRDLGFDLEGQKPKKSLKKKTTSTVVGPKATKPEASVAVSDAASHKGITRPRQSRLDDYIVFADSMEELDMLGGKFKANGIGGTRGTGSARSKEQQSGATPTSAPIDEERVPDPVPELTCKPFPSASTRN